MDASLVSSLEAEEREAYPEAESSPAPPSLSGYLTELESFLLRRVDVLEEDLRDMARASLSRGGKRIRPALVHACGTGTSVEPANLVKVGAVVEFVHVATLVHDDVLDDATIRRGFQTLYASRGATAAILLGDALFAHALEMAAEFPRSDVCRLVSAATRRTCAGEIRQSFRRGDYLLDRAEYLRIIEAKTAELFRVSCLLGARLAGRDEATCGLAAETGRRLGVAYQLYDDLADAFGREEDFGKTLGTDLAHGKVTLPVLTLFSHLEEAEAQRLLSSLRASSDEPPRETVEEIRDLLRTGDALDVCRSFLFAELEATEGVLTEIADEGMAERLDEIRLGFLRRVEDL